MLNIGKHRLVITKILKDVYSDFELSSILGLKGGTALYFFYDLPRFSVDLDFNLIDLSKKEFVHQRMKGILKGHGTVKEYFKKCITFIESVNQKNILQGLGEVLDRELKPWVKNKLISETIFYLRYYLEEIEKRSMK